MTNPVHPVDVQRPATLLDNFEDSAGAAYILNKSRSTVHDMADRGLITRYRVGAAVLYFRPELQEVAAALQRLRVVRA
jgi:hypothetical protein